MRHLPTPEKYSGITLVLSNPSRFDLDTKPSELLSARAGTFICDNCLYPYVKRQHCDIRTSDTIDKGLLKGTKGIILFGEKAFYDWTTPEYQNYLLQEQRGYLIKCKLDINIPTIATWSPQDSMDPEDYESKLNPLLRADSFKQRLFEIKRKIKLQASSEAEGEDKRRRGVTSRANYRFWTTKDIQKLLQISFEKLPKDTEQSKSYTIKYFPSTTFLKEALLTSKNKDLCLDIETDSEFNITVLSICLDKIVYTIPVKRYTGGFAYQNMPEIFSWIAIALRDNITICHNSMFDLFVLAWRYSIPLGDKQYDTMLAHNRIFNEIEKSLGHCISHLTFFERYHKDDGIFEPKTSVQEQQLWRYNAMDVISTQMIKNAMDLIAKKDPGLDASIQQSNDMIVPYLCMQLQGIKFSEEKRASIINENDKRMQHILRALKILVGTDFLPTSNKQCSQYFKDGMNYPTLKKSKRTGDPSWDEGVQWELKLLYKDNPVIDFCLKYRELAKETGSLKFEPWLI
jgi:hypothetical protein